MFPYGSSGYPLAKNGGLFSAIYSKSFSLCWERVTFTKTNHPQTNGETEILKRKTISELPHFCSGSDGSGGVKEGIM